MAQLFTAPFHTTFDSNGDPISGAKLFFYATGTLTLVTVYQDAARAVPHAIPVVANSAGRFPGIYLPDVLLRVRVCDADSVIIPGGDIDPIGDSNFAALAQPDGATKIGYQSTATGAYAEVLRAAIDRVGMYVEAYKLVSDPDYTLAFQRMFASTGHSKNFFCFNEYTITATLTPPSDCTIEFGNTGKITVITANTPALNLQNVAKVNVLNGKFAATTPGINPYVSAIVMDNAQHCRINRCEISGFQWGGVYMVESNYNTISENYIRNLLGAVPNAADINVYQNSSNNMIFNNRCLGGRAFGINVQDPVGTGLYNPQNNKVVNNTCIGNTIYGINVYIGGQNVNTYTASIAGTVMTVTGTPTAPVAVGQQVFDPLLGVLDFTWITALGTGTGGAGTYTVSKSQTVASRTMTGILARNSSNLIQGNNIISASGSELPAGGNGIYCVGLGLGGLQVLDNNVSNCCTATLNRSNAPAGIAVTGFGCADGAFNAVRPIVQGNIVYDMTQGDGIAVINCSHGVAVGPNTVDMPPSNNGSGLGGPGLTGNALRFNDSNSTSAKGGTYTNRGLSDAILVLASTKSTLDVSIDVETAYSAQGYAVTANRLSASYFHVRMKVIGPNGEAPGAFQMVGVQDGEICDFRVKTTNAYAGVVANCLDTVFSRNRLSGTNAITTSGVCTGSFFDKSNILTGNVENGATGLVIERWGTAVPATGAGAISDFVDNRVKAVGQPKGWTCTTAGFPGTWTSVGNL